MKRFIFCCIVMGFAGAAVKAQAPQPLSSSEILLGIKKLDVLGTVLYVGAHPDDENTRLLAYLAKERLYRTGYLSLTRGDGGQNLIGNEQGVELGLIRTQELLAARRIDGAEQFFSRAFDFGYSKSTEEALKIWDKEKILSDVVWVIRRFQPDVIITRFPQDARAGHGHHSASALLAVEAFTAAADPTRFPEQLKYVKVWQAKRALWNTFNFGSVNTTSSDQLSFDVGIFNPVLGKSYGEIAADSRSQHKSQGFGVARQRGVAMEYFLPWKGEPARTDIMDGVNTSWTRVKGGEAVQQKIQEILQSYSLFAPGKSVKGLVELYRLIDALPDGYWKKQKLGEVQTLIEAASALFADATCGEARVAQTDSLKVNFFLNNRNGNTITLNRISVDGFDTVLHASLASNQNYSLNKLVVIPADAPISQPYWLEHEMKEGRFEVNDQQLIGNADNEPALKVKFSLTIEGQDFDFIKPVRQKYTDPVKGEQYQPLAIVPPVVITPNRSLLLSATPDPQTMRLTVRAMKDIPFPQVKLTGSKGWQTDAIHYASPDILRKGQEMDVDVELKPVLKDREMGKQLLLASVDYNKQSYAEQLKTISYDHIPTVNYFRPSAITILTLDLKIAGKKIGYIEGAGDYIPVALQQMGYEVTTLSDNMLANSNLGQYDAIITGVRAYNIKTSLTTYYNKLMKYVENGGNLVVQYNTSSQVGPLRAKIAPYPFDISRTRITDEKAVVKVLKPDHPVMNYPNKITDQDFDGWVQERSIYHAEHWDSHYETIFSMHDPGESDDEGSLIIARYGKGVFVYTGLVFYRELPAGVPGAYRLLANILALNHKKGF
ncbi:MAG TPA: PIG-L family deacetylase [Chitinophagaceae bacterium]